MNPICFYFCASVLTHFEAGRSLCSRNRNLIRKSSTICWRLRRTTPRRASWWRRTSLDISSASSGSPGTPWKVSGRGKKVFVPTKKDFVVIIACRHWLLPKYELTDGKFTSVEGPYSACFRCLISLNTTDLNDRLISKFGETWHWSWSFESGRLEEGGIQTMLDRGPSKTRVGHVDKPSLTSPHTLKSYR